VSKSKKLHASGELMVKSVIIYDDLALVAKANARSQHWLSAGHRRLLDH
jgi:hypothetical protein